MVSRPRGPLALPTVVEVADALTVDILTEQRTGPERTTAGDLSELSAEEVIVRSHFQQVEPAIAEWIPRRSRRGQRPFRRDAKCLPGCSIPAS